MSTKMRFLFLTTFLVLLLGAGLLFRGILSSYLAPARKSIESEHQDRDKTIDQQLDRMSTYDKVASLFMFHTPGTDPNSLKTFIKTYGAGGLILMGDNLPSSRDDTLLLTRTIRGTSEFPPLLAIDQEGGTVKRLSFDTFKAGIELARASPEETSNAFRSRSDLLSSVGIPVNFGIVADVSDEPGSFIYPRVLGTDPDASSTRVSAAVGASKGRVYSTLKHFPGHGESATDSHVTIPTTDVTLEQWRRRDKPPFIAGIEAGSEFVMMGHLRYSHIDSEPASLSKTWYEILRKEMAFNGIAVTDDMLMLRADPPYDDMAQDAISALNAGATMLLYVTQNPAGSDMTDPADLIHSVWIAAESGMISKKVLDQDARKLLEARFDSRNLGK